MRREIALNEKRHFVVSTRILYGHYRLDDSLLFYSVRILTEYLLQLRHLNVDALLTI